MSRLSPRHLAGLLALALLSATSFSVAASDAEPEGAAIHAERRTSSARVDPKAEASVAPRPVALDEIDITAEKPTKRAMHVATYETARQVPKEAAPVAEPETETPSARGSTAILPIGTIDEHGYHTPKNPFLAPPPEVARTSRVDVVPKAPADDHASKSDDRVIDGINRVVSRGLTVDLNHPAPDDASQTSLAARANLWPMTLTIVGKFE